jgi:hypothetical protein
MCPACLASAAIWIGGVTSAGGLAVLAARLRYFHKDSPRIKNPKAKEQ